MDNHSLFAGSQLWIPEKNEQYQLAEIVRRDGTLIKVCILENNKTFSLDLHDSDVEILPANTKVAADMTSLQHLHMPGILHNLRQRSISNQPYTFLGGNVLVAVNPLKRLEKASLKCGDRGVLGSPHPYAIAEGAYQQLCFGIKRTNSEEPVNQTILVSGESGAGKTESSKLVLNHIVQRCGSDGSLDRRLLDSNPILEAFGNAATKRNHNSSRFGKFMKLHFSPVKNSKELHISGATVETYLLERSRVTSHGKGERGYHVFYQLVAGASEQRRSDFKLDGHFRYLISQSSKEASSKSKRRNFGTSSQHLAVNDGANFGELCSALETIGIPEESKDGIDQEEMFSIVAALLHLGNCQFVDDESTSEGCIAIIENDSAMDLATELLGVSPKKLRRVFLERKVKAVGEEIVKRNNAKEAKDALDAVVRKVYVLLFEWLVMRISKSLSSGEENPQEKHQNFIGVLDIFGFETFTKNDFEQLLINYANEVLQISFYKQIFEAEASLFEQEGLLDMGEARKSPPDNMGCLELLKGKNKQQIGILGIIDAEGRNPKPTDVKLNVALHKTYKSHRFFPSPHPKDIQTQFIVKHFAGTVKYTVGNFLQKNSDKVPQGATKLMGSSTLNLLKELGECVKQNAKKETQNPSRRSHRATTSTIASTFKKQISQLVTNIELTRCSFIRCVKPNPHMTREEGKDNWFDTSYVTNQLENLSVRQTTEVLQSGFPTRIKCSEFVDTYVELLPEDALTAWETLGRKSEREFVKALFYAFQVELSGYKMGLSYIFFKSGVLGALTEMLAFDSTDCMSDDIVERFRFSFSRALWKRCLAKLRVIRVFTSLLDLSRERNGAVTILQRLARKKLGEVEAKAELARLRAEKRKVEEEAAKRKAHEARERVRKLEQEVEEALAKKEKNAKKLKREEEKMRIKAEAEERKAQLAAAEKSRVDTYRKELEEEVILARIKEETETKNVITRLGGSDAYRAQKERERGIKFNDTVTVEEFVPYFTMANMEPSNPFSGYGIEAEDDDEGEVGSVMDLDDIAKNTKLADHKPEKEKKKKKKKPVPVAPKSALKPKLKPKPESIHAVAKWSVEERAIEPTGSTRISTVSSTRNKLACLGQLAFRKKKSQVPVFHKRHCYEWNRCFVSLKGMTLMVYETHANEVGENVLSCVDVSCIIEMERFSSASDNPKFHPVRDTPEHIIRLVHRFDPSILLQFSSREECDKWSVALDWALSGWRKSVSSIRLSKGRLEELHSNCPEEIKGHDSESETEEVTIYGTPTTTSDKRVLCDECRAVNYVCVEEPMDGDIVFECRECQTELRVLDEKNFQPTPILQSGNDLSSSLGGGNIFPITVQLADFLLLTVNMGEVVTSRKHYYFSFKCAIEDDMDKRKSQFWEISYSHEAYRTFGTSFMEYLDERQLDNLVEILPVFPNDPPGTFDEKSLAEERMKRLNEYMVSLMSALKEDPLLGTFPPFRKFFNLATIRVSPLALNELQDLEETFQQLASYPARGTAPPSQAFRVYEKVLGCIGRLEACADQDIVFGSVEDAAIANLSMQEKGEMFSMANDFLRILEEFQTYAQEHFEQVDV